EFEEKQLQNVIDDTYNMFITDVATARNLDVKNHTSFADAKIFTSKQAKEVGLVDEVATLTFAQNSLITLAKVQNPVWKKEDKFDKFLDRLVTETVSNISMNFVSGLKAY
ncbi:MAG: S49 family peptidase, partial [Flavobacteriales bacterium]|nr:S49 family peptidase [Flavobacteriales bacterium]